MSQIIIFSPFEALFNEKTNMLHFLPVCSKYAAVCSNRDFFPMSTPSRCIQHTKLALFPNFSALPIKITSGYISGTYSLDYKLLSDTEARTMESKDQVSTSARRNDPSKNSVPDQAGKKM